MQIEMQSYLLTKINFSVDIQIFMNSTKSYMLITQLLIVNNC